MSICLTLKCFLQNRKDPKRGHYVLYDSWVPYFHEIGLNLWNLRSYILIEFGNRFLLHPLQLHNIKTIMCYGCFMMKEVWWKILLEFRSIGMNRSFATKMWVFVPYIYCRHLAWIVLWVFIKGKQSKLMCSEMLPFRRK